MGFANRANNTPKRMSDRFKYTHTSDVCSLLVLGLPFFPYHFTTRTAGVFTMKCPGINYKPPSERQNTKILSTLDEEHRIYNIMNTLKEKFFSNRNEKRRKNNRTNYSIADRNSVPRGVLFIRV